LKYDLAKVRQHSKDSRTLLWWYLLPFLVGMNVSTWGMKVDLLTVKIPMTVLVALIAGVTYWLNRRVWRKQVASDAAGIGSAPQFRSICLTT
jgi:hypothetical protein